MNYRKEGRKEEEGINQEASKQRGGKGKIILTPYGICKSFKRVGKYYCSTSTIYDLSIY